MGVRILLPYLLLLSLSAHSQDPVHFTFESKRIQPGIYDISIFAQIDSGWHIYSCHGNEFGVRISHRYNPMLRFLKLEEHGFKIDVCDTAFHTHGQGYKNNVIYFQNVITKNRKLNKVSGEILYLAGDGKQVIVNRIHYMISLN